MVVQLAKVTDFDRLLKAEEVGRVLGVSKSRAYALMSSGMLPVIRIGRSVRISERNFQRWIDEQSERIDDVA